MHPRIATTPNIEEISPGFDRSMCVYAGIYAPFVWLTVMVMRLGLRAGFISPESLMPSRPDITPQLVHKNRQLRRGQSSCLRRVRRHALKGRAINPKDYTPRAHAYFAYIERMDKTISLAQFKEHYIRHNNISRVQAYGLGRAHEITGFVTDVGDALSKVISGMAANLASVFGLTALSFAALTDPAPP